MAGDAGGMGGCAWEHGSNVYSRSRSVGRTVGRSVKSNYKLCLRPRRQNVANFR